VPDDAAYGVTFDVNQVFAALTVVLADAEVSNAFGAPELSE